MPQKTALHLFYLGKKCDINHILLGKRAFDNVTLYYARL
jgi:hypothetical protein